MGKKRKLRSRDGGTFSYIHDALKGYINEIDGFGVGVYWFISTFTSKHQEWAWPSRETMAKGLNCNIKRIDKYLRMLESTDPPLIERVKRPGTTDKIYFLPVIDKSPSTKDSPKKGYPPKSGRVPSPKKGERGIPQNRVPNKTHKKKNHKKKNHTAKKRGSESVSESLFEDDKAKLNKQKLKDSFEYRSSVKLYNALKTKRKIGKISNFKKWPHHFRELMQFKTKKRIKIVLHWYLNHFTERWCPKAYCARTFREKFAGIEDAMRRKDDDALLEDEQNEAESDNALETSEYTDNKGQKHIITKTPGTENDFPSEEEVVFDKNGKEISRTSSIIYDEPEQDEDEDDDED